MSTRPFVAALCLWATGIAHAQPASCSSDGQAQPTALLERFINADCESCWADKATVPAKRGELALDWIVPGARGEDAPLATAATRDAVARLEAAGQNRPLQAQAWRAGRVGQAGALRVAHGLPFNGYIGTSTTLLPAGQGPWTTWVALVENLPAGTEGSAVERNLVRNVLQLSWERGAGARPGKFSEIRAMRIPEGANPDRLRVVGWVEDGRGRIGAIAQTRCEPPPAQR
jgi:hypothetical protein